MTGRQTIAQFVMQAPTAMEQTRLAVPTETTPPRELPPVPHAQLVSSAPPLVPCQRPAHQEPSSPPTPPEIVAHHALALRIARTQPIQPPVLAQISTEMVTTVTLVQLGTAAQEDQPPDATPPT